MSVPESRFRVTEKMVAAAGSIMKLPDSGGKVTSDVISIIDTARVRPTRRERLRTKISSIRGR